MIDDADIIERVLDRWDGTWPDLFRVLDDPRATLRDLATEVRRLQHCMPTAEDREALRQMVNGQIGPTRRAQAKRALDRLGVFE